MLFLEAMSSRRGLTDEELEVLRALRKIAGPRKRLGYMRKLYVIRGGL